MATPSYMAIKYVRINPKSTNTVIQNLFGANRFIRKNYQISNFRISGTDYSDGDKIEIRVGGAKRILFVSIQNANDGTPITLETIDAYTKGANDKYNGMYVRTAAISTAVCLNVIITSSIVDDPNVIFAKLTSS